MRAARLHLFVLVGFACLPPLAVLADDSFAGRLSIDLPLLTTVVPEGEAEDSEAGDPDSDALLEGATLESDSPPLGNIPLDHVLLSAGAGMPWRFAQLFEEQAAETHPDEILEELGSVVEVPIVRNDKVESHIRFFQIAIRDRFQKWLLRLAHYKPLVDTIFSEFDLPSDLVYLSLVESGFNPHAYSRARATGPWQFMKGTARLYGLRVDRYVDERRDPIKSTVAAARYLRDLYDLFGTWPLAMAAYNAGEGRVMRALQKAGAENFWEIARTKHLKRETKEYVPRFMAATIIAKNPDEYGFIHDAPVPHQFEEVVIRRSVQLRTLASATGLSLQELRRLNPELRLDVTPPNDENYHLKVPVGTSQAVVEALDRVPTSKATSKLANQDTRKRGGLGSYRVRVGDSLWAIAKRFNLTVGQLKAWNRSAARGIRPGDLLIIEPIH